MAKTRTAKKHGKTKKENSKDQLTPELAPGFIEHGSALLASGEAEDALISARKALTCLTQPGVPSTKRIPALELIGEALIELGEAKQAQETFKQAADLDPDATLAADQGGGADKFLWLAQLNETGGVESISWFEKGCTVLRREIAEGEAEAATDDDHMVVEMKKQKLANALCGAAEVYMTDLSWEEDCEARCEALVTEACLAAPESPDPLQTLASIRLSQHKTEDARSALIRSLEMWTDLSPEDPDVPDFPTRISLSRLLMDAEMEDRALEVLERLIGEDDSSVEAWYLGGWCLYLLAEKQRNVSRSGQNMPSAEVSSEPTRTFKSSRDWLLRSLKLFDLLAYEDERLQQHAKELVAEMNKILGAPPAEDAEAADDDDDDDDDDDNDDWEDDDGNFDAKMADT